LRLKIEEKLAISRNKIDVIHNGVDIKRFNRPVDRDRLLAGIAAASGVSIKGTDFILGIIGSLKPEKNQIMALRALKELNHTHKDKSIKLLLIGDGEDKEKLKIYAKQNELSEQVAFLGLRDDVPALLSVLDVLMSTSLSGHEGLSNVLLEAMASSVATISTKSVGAMELIQDGKNGIIIEPNDHTALAGNILWLRENHSTKCEMAENGRKTVEKDFSLEKMIKKYEQLYFQLVDKKKKRD